MKLEKLAEYLCLYFGKTIEQMAVKSRKRENVVPRQMIQKHLCDLRQLNPGWSLHRIGNLFNQDHATVLNSRRNINNLVATNRKERENWEGFKRYADQYQDQRNSLMVDETLPASRYKVLVGL